ncbi:putative glycoside hydrolase [uncultured Methanobrevibacter sp.]|uniref:putative glycoside hydrolase n=1 Tax=uncultured Methanobrevibacter sp. TaxID=253161 RepID=UPI00261A91E0|nr:putative glycoside hydrolase [uncultured Methanobrevibacter sp.]
MASVSAGDINETTDTLASDDSVALSVDAIENEVVADDNQSDGSESENANISDDSQDNDSDKIIQTSVKTSSESVFIKDSKFSIRLLDADGKGISGKEIEVNFKNKVSKVKTDTNGYAYFKLYAKGTYTLSYSFTHEGYAPVKGSKTVTIVGNTKSKISGSSYVAYVGVANPYTVSLTTGGIKMPNKKVVFKIKGKTYTVKTNSKGKATLNIDLAKGTYTIKYTFKGVKNAKSASGSSKITVKKGMPTKIVRMNSLTYRHQTSAPLIFKYKDARGNALASKTIVMKFGSKTYTKKTDSKGLVTFNIKKNMGSYKVSVSSYNTKVYKASSNSYTIKVKSNNLKYNGFWLFGSDMKSVNLKTMAKKGVNQIFLNEYAFTLYGKSGVSAFACKAKSLGINVHIWMMAFNDGSWISPVTSSGKYKYSLFNSIIDDAKEYASVKGVAGIHFDYIRFPGTAYKHANGADAITYFTKKACNELHKLNSSLIVSAAVMAEPSAMKYYYGQDIPQMTKYLDMIIPMVYKGNYNQNSAWIKSVTQQFVKQSNGAIVLTGLQGYYSDSYVKKLPASNLINDADNAAFGGASGVIVFRYSLFNMINFKNL